MWIRPGSVGYSVQWLLFGPLRPICFVGLPWVAPEAACLLACEDMLGDERFCCWMKALMHGHQGGCWSMIAVDVCVFVMAM